ncbi:MAG: hypothetical protein JST00_35130 [Deltaproteobacteria bacterium]|nr:hypothetical protein [Deltaproteobacteria bacterium]
MSPRSTRGRVRARVVVTLGVASIMAAACGLTVTGSGPAASDAGVDAPSSDGAPSVADVAAPDAEQIPPEGGTEVILEEPDAGEDAEADAGPLAFEIVAPDGGGKYTIFPPGTSMPCTKSGAATAFRFENRSPSNVRMYWYDYACVEDDYGKVNKNTAYTQGTYVGHRWRVRRDSDGKLLGDFVLDAVPPSGQYRVIVR